MSMRSAAVSDEPLIAVFVDFENLAIGVRGMKSGQFLTNRLWDQNDLIQLL